MEGYSCTRLGFTRNVSSRTQVAHFGVRFFEEMSDKLVRERKSQQGALQGKDVYVLF